MPVLTTASASVTNAVDRRRSDMSLTSPTHRQVALAGIAAVLGSLILAFALAELGRSVFNVPATFDKFNFGGYAVLTLGGVIGATIAWGLVSRYAPTPRELIAQLAVLVTIVLLLPDLFLFTQAGNPTGPVLMLMVMHVAIAVVSYYALVVLAPVRRVEAR